MRSRSAVAWLIIPLAVALSGCITTSMQGYADRDLPAHPLQHLAAYVAAPGTLSSSINASVVDEARRRGLNAEDALTILPPTRTYNQVEVRKALEARGVDGVLLITVGDTGVQRQYAGTIFSSSYSGTAVTSGTITGTGNMATFGANTNYSGTSTGSATPTYRYSRQTNFVAKLLDAKTGRTLWVGNGQVNAGGLLFVGNGAASSNAIFGILDDLQKKGLIEAAGT